MTDLHIGFYMDHDTLDWHQFDPTPGSVDMDEVLAEGWNYMVVHFWNVDNSSTHHSFTMNVGNLAPTDFQKGLVLLENYIKSLHQSSHDL
jgi:hypothetical protein